MELSRRQSATREVGNVPALVFLGRNSVRAAPALTRASKSSLDSVVLRRANDDLSRVRVARECDSRRCDFGNRALQVVTRTKKLALSAESVRWQETSPTDGHSGPGDSRMCPPGALAPTSLSPRPIDAPRSPCAGFRGGRRLLSDDVAMLESIAQLLGRCIDAIRIERERQEQSGAREEGRSSAGVRGEAEGAPRANQPTLPLFTC